MFFVTICRNIQVLPDAVSDAYMRTIDTHFITQVMELLDLPSNAKINFAQFEGVAAFSERYFFNIFT